MGIGFKELVVILLIVLVLFGAKRLGSIGSDLGSAIKNFRKSVREAEDSDDAGEQVEQKPGGNVIEGEVTKHKEKV